MNGLPNKQTQVISTLSRAKIIIVVMKHITLEYNVVNTGHGRLEGA